MANEFIARKGLKVLASGIEVTGSSNFSTDVSSSGNIKATAFYGDGANVTGVISSSYAVTASYVKAASIEGTVTSASYATTSSYAVTASLATNNIVTASGAGSTITFTKGDGSTFPVTITVGSSATASYVEYTNVANKPTLVSASSQIDHNSTTNYVANQHVDHSTVSVTAGSGLSGGGDITATRTLSVNSGSMLPYYSSSIFGAVSGDITINSATGVATIAANSVALGTDTTGNYAADVTAGSGISVSGVAGEGISFGVTLDTGSAHFTAGSRGTISSANTVGASGINLTYNNTSGIISGSLVNSSVTVNGQSISLGGSGTVTANTTNTLTLGNGLTGTSFNGSLAVTTNVDTGSVHFTDGVKAKLNSDGVVSSSAQIDVRNTTGIATIATTGSNTFTGIQTISNTTNSTNYTDGALIVQGGVGIAKDVNISGSLTVTGLLTAVSMSTLYVTSSQYTIGTSRVIVNDDDLVRFAGLSVVDSGSTYGTGSLLWDSLNNRWIYEANDQNYNSAVIIAGPKNYGTLGNEVGLTVGRIPVATGDDHIDTNAASSSMYIDFGTLRTYIEAGLTVTGSVTSSGGFSGDGSNLTGIVTNLNISGSDGGNGTVSLKTQALTVSGSNGVVATANGQTITISGSDATTTTKGVASFNSTNFTVTAGAVTSNNININGTNVTLGGTRNITLAQITTQGATTTDQVTLGGGAIIHGVLFTSSSAASLTDGANQVVASVATGSYDSAMFDYVIKDGTNFRAGTVTSVWKAGTTSVEYTDTSTNDIGNTLNQSFAVDTSSGNVRLKFTTTGGGTWTVKTAIRML